MSNESKITVVKNSFKEKLVDDFESVFESFGNHVKIESKIYKEWILLKARYNDNEQYFNHNIHEKNSLDIERNRIRGAFLDLLEKCNANNFHAEVVSNIPIAEMNSLNRGKYFKFILLGLAFIIASIAYYFGTKAENANTLKLLHPSELSVWMPPKGVFKWYNAPFAYASSNHYEVKKKWFDDPNFKLEIIVFDCSKNDSLRRIEVAPKLANMRVFINRLNNDKIDVKDRIKIKVIDLFTIVPRISYFTTNTSTTKNPYSIIYFGELGPLGIQPKPNEALVTYAADVNRLLSGSFEGLWLSARNISISKLISNPESNVSLSNFYE